MSASLADTPHKPSANRESRLGFRVDAKTKDLIEQAAELERRSMTDYCLSVLIEASRKTVERHQKLELSERDREFFFDTLMNPPELNERLSRAFALAGQVIAK
jgi:uncharacterized protein (DUF1778 family)